MNIFSRYVIFRELNHRKHEIPQDALNNNPAIQAELENTREQIFDAHRAPLRCYFETSPPPVFEGRNGTIFAAHLSTSVEDFYAKLVLPDEPRNYFACKKKTLTYWV